MGKRKKTGHISFWVEAEFKKALEDYAIKDKRTISNLVEKILADWMEIQAQEQKGEPYTRVLKSKKGA